MIRINGQESKTVKEHKTITILRSTWPAPSIYYKVLERLFCMLLGFLDIADGLITILSFGFLYSKLSFKGIVALSKWRLKHDRRSPRRSA